jgi:hypothetical protein
MAQRPFSAFVAIFTLALATGPALAKNMMVYNNKTGCRTLVDQAHPGLKGRARGDEIRKCKSDPDAYNKAAGF